MNHETGSIPVKVGEKRRSAAVLRKALAEQLVGKYMAPETRRAGVLLVTLADDKRWEHPDTGEALEFSGLIAMLNDEARQIMEGAAGALCVSARGLDLRPRLTAERGDKRVKGSGSDEGKALRPSTTTNRKSAGRVAAKSKSRSPREGGVT